MALSLLRFPPARLLGAKLRQRPFQVACISDHLQKMIGNRQVVGYGFNGQPSYCDRDDFPFPAVRFRETTPELEALREKEKGDWNELTCQEKKTLYRASFCQTFAEFTRSNEGEWKFAVAMSLFLCVPALLIMYFYQATIYRASPIPISFSESHREAMFRRWLDLKANPIRGLASKWDYEKDDWKDPKDPWKLK